MKKYSPLVIPVLISSLALAPLTGCEQLPGDEKTQGAVIGGVGGAVAGGAIAKNNRLLGALIGGALGAGGGYLIGSQIDKSRDNDENREAAREAERRARENPVSTREARDARTADVNDDGYVTLDEVVALHNAGFSDDEMITRLERTNQFFELTQEQEDFLRDKGVSRRVVVAMRDVNADIRDRAYASSNRNDRVGRD